MGQCKCEVDKDEVKVRLLEQAGKPRHSQLQGESMANRAQGCRNAASDNDSLLLFVALFFRSTSFFLSFLSLIHVVYSVLERRERWSNPLCRLRRG